jgi:hypothetical protein
MTPHQRFEDFSQFLRSLAGDKPGDGECEKR